MNKILVLVSLLAIGFWATTALVSAQEQTSAGQATTSEVENVDLGVENPGILPSSPFYFLKEWRRSITRFFTTDPVKKAELELNEANERAAEIKKLEETAPSKIEAITKAVNNYQQNMERLMTRLEELKETSQNPNVDKLLDKLVDRSIKHQELFDNLRVRFEQQAELRERLRVGQETINDVITKIPQRFENAAAFEERLRNRIENLPENPIRDLRTVDMLDKIGQKLPEQQQKIQEIKDNLIQKIENKLENLKSAATTTILKLEIQGKIQEIKRERERNKERVCIQVITSAISPARECKQFPTPCDVPDDWEKVDACPTTGTSTQE